MTRVTRYSDNKRKSPAQRCQIGKPPVIRYPGLKCSLLLNVTQATWLRPLLNVARSEVSCHSVPRSQVYVRLLLNVTRATWLGLLLNVARSEVSCHRVRRSQVTYASC